MSTREEREVARIRHELRERLMTDRQEGVGELLASLWRLVLRSPASDLRGEYERWKLRFELLAA